MKRLRFIEVGPESELAKWSYTLDEDNGIIILEEYTNIDARNIIVYGAYSKDGKVYNTKLSSDMSYMFCNCKYLKEIKGIENFDTSKCTDMMSIFYNCSSVISLDLTSFDTSNVTEMAGMFCNCTNLKEIKGIENFDTSKCTDMGYMFSGCTALTSLDLTSFDTSNVIFMCGMFSGCTALTSLDLTSFDTSEVNNMRSMFMGCTNLKEIKVSRSKWKIKSRCDTTDMFDNCGCSEVTYVD